MTRLTAQQLREQRREKRKHIIEKEQSKGGGLGTINLPKDTSFLRVESKTYHLNIIPYIVSVENNPYYEKGEQADYRPYLLHRGIGAENISLICPKTIGKKCPICEKIAELSKNYDENKEQIKSLKPQKKALYNVIDLDDRDKKDEIQIFDSSMFAFGELLLEEIKASEEYDYSEIDCGKVVEIRFKEKEYNGRNFIAASKINFVERDEQYDESIFESSVDLDTILEIKTYDQIRKIFYDEQEIEPIEESAKEQIDEEEQEEKVPVKKTIVKKKAPEPEQEQPVETEQPIKKERARTTTASSTECPAGYPFGDRAYCTKHAECDDCDEKIWNKCLDKAGIQ